jgi:hypothetical protein
MKQHELTFSIIKIPLDFVVICVSFLIAKEMRLNFDLVPGLSLPIQTINQSSLNMFALY